MKELLQAGPNGAVPLPPKKRFLVRNRGLAVAAAACVLSLSTVSTASPIQVLFWYTANEPQNGLGLYVNGNLVKHDQVKLGDGTILHYVACILSSNDVVAVKRGWGGFAFIATDQTGAFLFASDAKWASGKVGQWDIEWMSDRSTSSNPNIHCEYRTDSAKMLARRLGYAQKEIEHIANSTGAISYRRRGRGEFEPFLVKHIMTSADLTPKPIYMARNLIAGLAIATEK
jgi:hypothetical protein